MANDFVFSSEISALDLEPLMVKAMDDKEGHGWSLEKAKFVAAEYKKFLQLCLIYKDKAIVPTGEVDDFWHLHILDTQKYAEDCQTIFGYFLHHFPYFGMRGEEDSKNLHNSFEDTCKLYEKHFGVASKEVRELWGRVARCPNCGREVSEDSSTVLKTSRPKLEVA